MKKFLTFILSVLLSFGSVTFFKSNRVKEEVEPTYFTIDHYDDFKQQYPTKAKEIETYIDHFLESVNMDRSNREFNESYHILDGEVEWELYADIGEYQQWKCYVEMKEQDGQVVMTASYIDFTTPDRVNDDLLKKMARVMDYNALLITKLYEDYVEDYQTNGKVRKEIQLDKYNKVVFAYVRSPNGNSLMIDMTKNF